MFSEQRASDPSVILFRRSSGRRAEGLAEHLEANLEAMKEDLDAGAVVVFGEASLRVRRLPLLAG